MTDIDRPALLSSVGGAVIDAVALAVCVGALRGCVVEDVVVVDRHVQARLVVVAGGRAEPLAVTGD